MNSKDKGELTEAIVTAEMMRAGLSVSQPVSENNRYDFIVDFNGDLLRIQCKTGRYENGSVIFNVSSVNFNTTRNSRQDYHGDVEGFVVHCHKLDETYYVPIENVGTSTKHIRVEENLNGGNVDYAEKYLLENQFE